MREPLRIPAEWEGHDACWLAFPYLADEWPDSLEPAQRAVSRLCQAIAGPGEERVRLLVKNDAIEEVARRLIGKHQNVQYVRADYGDCWVRDTAPLFGRCADGTLGSLRFSFNGWGSKYDIPYDRDVGRWLEDRVGAVSFASSLTLEGGALETDGRGTFLTTASCVLNDNRNPGLTKEGFERALDALALTTRVIWLDQGLAHDHTDGHVDMIARFAPGGGVLCMRPDPAAPNAQVLDAIVREIHHGGFSTLELPAAPSVHAEDGAPLPASYCNFYVANRAVIVPIYEAPSDARALAVLREAFPGREAIGLPARDLLSGGGAFHCVTQPEPASP